MVKTWLPIPPRKLREGSSRKQIKGSNPDNSGGPRPPAPPAIRANTEQVIRVIHEFAECTCPNCGTTFNQDSLK